MLHWNLDYRQFTFGTMAIRRWSSRCDRHRITQLTSRHEQQPRYVVETRKASKWQRCSPELYLSFSEAAQVISSASNQEDVEAYLRAESMQDEAHGGQSGMKESLIVLLQDANSENPVSREQMLEHLIRKFPNRNVEKLRNMVACFPSRFRKQFGTSFHENKQGFWIS